MYWEELCFVMTMFCSAGKCTVTDNKFCTISEPKKHFMCEHKLNVVRIKLKTIILLKMLDARPEFIIKFLKRSLIVIISGSYLFVANADSCRHTMTCCSFHDSPEYGMAARWIESK
jgi:hypothetical protein